MLLFVVEYSSQTMFVKKLSYVGWYGALRAVLIKDFNDCRRVIRSETDVQARLREGSPSPFIRESRQHNVINVEHNDGLRTEGRN